MLLPRYKKHCSKEIKDEKDQEESKDLLMEVRDLYSRQPNRLVVAYNPLEKTLEELRSKRDMLDDISVELEIEVQQKETEPLMERTNRVKRWLENTGQLLKKVDAVLTPCHCKNNFSNPEIQKDAINMVSKIDLLLNQREQLGVNLVLSAPLPESASCSSTKLLIGMEENKSKVIKLLKDENSPVIGVHGLGGIGKTTLLKEIRNEHCSLFDLYIFVVVSNNPSIFKIQEDIGVSLGYKRAQDMTRGQRLPVDIADRADLLRRALSQRKFLLLLDDVWQKLDLSKVGIFVFDKNNQYSKVVLTTRDVNVCISMDAKQLKLSSLNEAFSHRLFREVVNDNNVFNNKEVEMIANAIVKKCGGLPLLLVTVGKAMSNKKHEAEWRHVKEAIDCFPDDIEGTDDVYHCLKLSFDNLRTDKLRSCLMFCCLFPEDANIQITRLVDYWIGEGLLDIDANYYPVSLFGLRDRGRYIVKLLQSSSLLEPGDEEDCVKLHNAVRDMCIWLGNGGGGHNFNYYKFLSLAGKDLTEVTINRRWKQCERISLMMNKIKTIYVDDDRASMTQANLLTLLLTGNMYLERLELDDLMSHLVSSTTRVIDLWGARVECFLLDYPMNALRYLNLAWSPIRELHLASLPCLQQLELSYTRKLRFISKPCTHTSLQSLKLKESSYSILHQDSVLFGLDDLLKMHNLEEFSVYIYYVNDIQLIDRLLNSEAITKATTCIGFFGVEVLTIDRISMAIQKMTKLEHVYVSRCPGLRNKHISLEENQLHSLKFISVDGIGGISISRQHGRLPFTHLRQLCIANCQILLNIQWLYCAPNLEYLTLKECEGVVELLTEGEEAINNYTCSQNLKSLELMNLPNLTHIYSRGLPCLQLLRVYGCPLLKKLPSLPGNTEIWCERGWWECLDWDNLNVKLSLQSRFHQLVIKA